MCIMYKLRKEIRLYVVMENSELYSNLGGSTDSNLYFPVRIRS